MTAAQSRIGRSSRNKGQVREREALRILQSLAPGLTARRTAASGGQEGYCADIELDLLGGIDIEVKYSSRDNGMTTIRRYLEPVHLVMSAAPAKGWVYTFKADVAAKLLQETHLMERIRAKYPGIVDEFMETPEGARGGHLGK